MKNCADNAATKSLYAKFSDAYSLARRLVRQGDPAGARRCVISCMETLAELYRLCPDPKEKESIYGHICSFKKISSELYDRGISATVKTAMNVRADALPADGEKEKTELGRVIGAVHMHEWCADIFAGYKGSVAEIEAVGSGNGTGFVISSKGYLLTNDHVLFDEVSNRYASQIRMSLDNGKYRTRVELIASDRVSDVALCRFDAASAGEEIRAVPRIREYSDLKQGAMVVIIGNALSMGIAPFWGIVRHTHGLNGDLIYDAQSNQGDSGAPVLNLAGECVGINKSVTVSVRRETRTIEVHGMANATPMDKINELLDKWCEEYEIEL